MQILMFQAKTLDATQGLWLILISDYTNFIKWYIYTSYSVRNEMIGRILVTLKMGKCSIISKSIKNKLNTKNLYITRASWYRQCNAICHMYELFFFKGQGYDH